MALKMWLLAHSSRILTIRPRTNPRTFLNKRMCVTWFMVNGNPEINGYKLVLAFNRDEYFNRPASPADFLESNKDVLCGVDMTPGKEGGTWLGISKTGRAALLLNIRETNNPDLKGRGSLVTNFLSSDTDGCSYMNQLTGSDYNGFNLITMDFSNANPELCYYSNRSESDPVKLESGFYGVSNTVLSQPWPKAKLGKAYLEQLLNDNPKITPKELTNKLMTFAGKTDGFSGTPTFSSHDEISEALPELVFVDLPVYGTRCMTVILIDHNDEVTFTEKTRFKPMDNSQENWSSKTHVFKFKSSL